IGESRPTGHGVGPIVPSGVHGGLEGQIPTGAASEQRHLAAEGLAALEVGGDVVPNPSHGVHDVVPGNGELPAAVGGDLGSVRGGTGKPVIDGEHNEPWGGRHAIGYV